MSARTGGELVVANLIAQGATHLFGVPGESYLPVLDALVDARGRLAFVTCRQEGGAAMMAEAVGKLTGRPGVAIVTRGPGASNAAIGVHVARQDSTPMVLLVGQVGTDFAGREAFQEVDYGQTFGSLAKAVVDVGRADRIPECIARAWHAAMSGRPGPVVVVLPEDVLSDRAQVADAPRVEVARSAPDPDALRGAHALLAGARRPLAIVGGSGWSQASATAMAALAARWDWPIACAFRRQDLIDHRHGGYAGDVGIGVNPALAKRVREADVLLVVGERLGEMTTSGYTLLELPVPRQRLIHVHPDPAEPGRVYAPAVGLAASPDRFVEAFAALDVPGERPWAGLAAEAHREYEAWREPRAVPGEVDLWTIVRWLDERLPDDAILTNGAGNYTTWIHRLFRHRSYGSQLAPYSGAMGYGVPSAIAARLVHPDRPVLSWNGDGCFLMNGQELATAVAHRLAIVFVVVDNGMYGTIRMHQERRYPDRVSGTDLVNPDFAALARAYGAHGYTVGRTGEFAPAFEAASGCGGPALIHVRLDPRAITMNASIDALRAAGRRADG